MYPILIKNNCCRFTPTKIHRYFLKIMGGKNEKKLQKIIVNAIACQYEIDTANNVSRLKV